MLCGRRKGGAVAAEAAAASAAFVPFSDDVRRLAAAAGVTERSTRREDDNVLRGVQTEEAEGTVTKVSHVAIASVVFLNQYASTAWASNSRIPGTSTFLTPARAGGRGPLLSTLPGVSSPLIQASQSTRPLGSPSIAGWAVPGISTSHPSPGSEPATYQSTLRVQRSEAELLNSDTECLPPSVSWLPLANPDRSILDVDIFQASQQVLSHRLAVPKLIFDNFETAHNDDDTPQHGQSPGSWSHPAESRVQFPERPASGIDEQIALLPVDQSPLNTKLLRLYIAVLSRFKASINGDPSPNNPFIRHYSPFCLQDPLVMRIILYTSACFLHETGDVRTDVLRTYKGQAIAMLNENLTTDSSKSMVPNTTALTATDANSLTTPVIQKPGDAAIAGVIQLTVAEWYWGESEQDLRYHLMGLRDMIRVRGGFNQLGMDGLLAKNAIVHDVSISLAHENSPLLLTLSPSDDDRKGGGSGCKGSTGPATSGGAANSARRVLAKPYAFVDPIKDVPLRMANLSPMVTHLPCSGSLPSFSDCATSLRIHPATASILDNVKYLLSVVDAIYDESTTSATTNPASLKARAMGKYMYEHISSLHSTIPGHRQSLSSDPPTRTNSPPTSNYSAAFDRESIRSESMPSTGTAAGPGSDGPGRSPSGPNSDSTTSEWSSTKSHTRDASDSPTSPRSAYHHQQSPDFMYQVIRMTALLYTRAVMTRTPLSGTCTESEFLQIWTTTWRVPLSTWNDTVGIFHWIMLAIAPACHRTPHARFVKNMLTISTLTLGVENWAMAMGAASTGMRLQHWLEGQDMGEQEEREEREEREEERRRGMERHPARGGRRSGREER
ncbi:hypothetical protein CABS01_01507 [Colletotrichum abscissum]|uniref:uncharacterized protein n=1 Tax=Colletotrichum abscissum TaxID=1671311 RepID=UPI0027D5C583|nr:uncharacterized protein CABS01_01507 [Colletotrichum abscissum]KAK1495700.1 hypothetical protein CABS01_01507 [Colletotrichum abscissum]